MRSADEQLEREQHQRNALRAGKKSARKEAQVPRQMGRPHQCLSFLRGRTSMPSVGRVHAQGSSDARELRDWSRTVRGGSTSKKSPSSGRACEVFSRETTPAPRSASGELAHERETSPKPRSSEPGEELFGMPRSGSAGQETATTTRSSRFGAGVWSLKCHPNDADRQLDE